MKKVDEIENFNKKSLYILIREMTDVNTAHITSVVNVLKKYYKKLINEYYEKGTIVHNKSGSFF
jgi:choline kinase